MDWFRSWHGAPTDPKWLVVARRAKAAPGMVSALAWALLDYASQHADRGSVENFDVETYAAFTGWEEDEINAILDAMRSKGIITEDNRLASWEKRQPKKEDPNSGKRVKAFRERERALKAALQENVTPCNDLKRSVATDQIDREDKKEMRGERPPAAVPSYPQEPVDPEYGAALSKLEALGMMTGSALLEFQSLWPDLSNGRRAWIDDAVTVAHANGASSPVYAIRVLANSIRTGNRPGETPQKQGARPQGHNLRELLGLDKDD